MGPLHGEVVTEGTGNGPETVVMHFGEITAYAAGESVSVRSDDGYAASYRLTPATIGGAARLRVGDMVRVVADKPTMTVQLLMASGR